MTIKYFDGKIPLSPEGSEHFEKELQSTAAETVKQMVENMDQFSFNLALENIWTLIKRTNKYVDETEPWILGRDKNKRKDWKSYLSLCESPG